MATTINIATILFVLVVHIFSKIARKRVENAIIQSSEFEGTAKQRKTYNYLNLIETFSGCFTVTSVVLLFISLISRQT